MHGATGGGEFANALTDQVNKPATTNRVNSASTFTSARQARTVVGGPVPPMMLAQQQARMQNQHTQESKRTGMGLSRRDEESEKIRQSIGSSEINYD